MDNNNKDSKHDKSGDWDKLKNITSEEEFQKEFDKILEKFKKDRGDRA